MLIKILFSLIGTLVIYGGASLVNVHLSIVMLISSVYLLPLVVNLVLEYFIPVKRKVVSIFTLSFITTIGYLIFGIIMMNHVDFATFVAENTVNAGEMYLRVEPNLISLAQLVFIFVLNFGVQYLFQMIRERGGMNHVRSEAIK